MLRFSLAPVPEGAPRFSGLPDWMSRLLWARGVRTEAEAEAFLSPGEGSLLPPEALPGVPEAAALLSDARAKGERVVVFGDYDVDGVCATAIMLEALRAFGVSCEAYLPDRHLEGYGLNPAAVEKLAKQYQVLLTVDCGITALEEVRLARALGMRAIVTDHHHIGDALPEADAVVSPLLCDYPFPYLCGAGVAYKLACALIGESAKKRLELAALATVADMVPLTGENRALVKLGLPCILRSSRPGLSKLMESAGIRDTLTAEQVGFQIAPRLNACGRMDSAWTALNLLMEKDAARAAEYALKAEALNTRRRDEEAQVIAEAEAQVARMDLVACHAVVICGAGWNSGVVGLAAGRVAEKYAYPTAVLTEQDGGICVGSARSAGAVDLFEALKECADLFVRFGGHQQAAGLTMEKANLPEFRRRFSEAVDRQTGGRPPIPEKVLDGEMALQEVTEGNIALLSRMEPFGIGNPAPRFLCRGAEALSLRAVGAEGRHLKCTFMQDGTIRDGIFFGGGEWARMGGGAYDLAMTPVLNVFRGNASPEIRLEALRLIPERMKRDERRELLSFLSDRREEGLPLLEGGEALDQLMAGQQGTLLCCRCLPTALEMRRRYPQADFRVGEAGDARAYHTVLLCGGAETVTAPFRHIVFCDGGPGWRKENAACFRLAPSRAFAEMLQSAALGINEMRACYLALRNAPRSLEEYAEISRVSVPQGAFALAVLGEIGLIEFSLSPFRVTLLPVQKISPERSALYRLARNEGGEHGVFGL